jgi:hypothetical protein
MKERSCIAAIFEIFSIEGVNDFELMGGKRIEREKMEFYRC